jgi:hypothetical protein
MIEEIPYPRFEKRLPVVLSQTEESLDWDLCEVGLVIGILCGVGSFHLAPLSSVSLCNVFGAPTSPERIEEEIPVSLS